ncbi:MAG: cytochrome c3 family protein [Candidatus Nitrospinota bacterium M3_3B_026]
MRFLRVWPLAALGLLLAALSQTSAHAQGFGVGRLISPGDLAASHEDFDSITKCIECHDLKGGVNEAKCLKCHENIRASALAERGYHGHKSVRSKKCVECHPDHKGKSFYMIVWPDGRRDKFDHDLTGYPLKAKHDIKKCGKCHTQKTEKGAITYIGAGRDCVSCHDDVHKKTLGEKCGECHDNFRSWKGQDVKFDHDRRSEYPLKGAHAKVQCEKCHERRAPEEAVFKVRAHEKCLTCHKKDDVHKGTLGEKCESCHVEASWKKVRFNHDKTKYPLKGAHLDAKCDSCHPKAKKGVYKVERYDTCSATGCHDTPRRGDIHGTQFKDKKCGDCHTEKGWKPTTFRHDDPAYKGYRLEGKHAEAKCEKCHGPTGEVVRYKKPMLVFHYRPIDASRCSNAGCHDTRARGAIHGEQFADRKCGECHTEKGWKPSTFRHDDPAYKGYRLEGKHAKVKCEKCHAKDRTGSVVYRPIKSDSCSNAGCHDTRARGAIHGDQFTDRKCGDCHTEKGWKPTTFRHDDPAYKGYKLEGKHAEVKCEKCHAKDRRGAVVYRPIKSDSCSNTGCHDTAERGAIHGDQFTDRKCGDCHTEKGWKPTTFRHDDPAYKGYKLEGKHAEVKCEKCHAKDRRGAVVYRPIKHDRCGSSSCHSDPHKGVLDPRRCEECHTERDWKDMKTLFDHTFDTRYPLTGKHREAKCEKCHENKRWKPVSMDCLACHRKDDEHKGKYGSECQECHTTATWSPKSIAHELTGFPLTQTHAQLVCADCHTKGEGDFSGLGPDCTQCHSDPHFNQMGRLCADCHTMRNWEPMKFKHSLTGFRLEGGHRFADCADCHKGRVYRNVPTDCLFCHRDDFFSPTATQFHTAGNVDCMECHSVYSWYPARGVSHKIMTFTGAHQRIKNDCAACHTTGADNRYGLKWPGAAYEQDCHLCHMADYNKEHTTCPQTCDLCHSTSAWGSVRPTIPCD